MEEQEELFPRQAQVCAPGLLVEVAVAVPVLHHLSYAVPEHLAKKVVPGVRVRVPIGSRRVTGFVVAVETRVPEGALKPVEDVLEERPFLTAATLALGLWVAKYYGAPPGEALSALVPAAIRHGRRQKMDVLVELVDAAAATALRNQHKEAASWQSRSRVLRALLETDDGLRLQEVLRSANVTVSPVNTLERAGVVRRRRVPAVADPLANLRVKPAEPPVLTDDQAAALDVLMPRLEAGRFSASLLHGVTGSGKTEVYLRLLERSLALGRTAILLVPEIALTPQTVERILGRVPDVAVLHSNLSEGDRAEQWQRLFDGRVKVAVGPRSALFAPLRNVGLIILDEEHETTFKQQQSPRYHARDAALERGRIEGALVLLGTATPSMESEGMVARGSIDRLCLPSRVGGSTLPSVGIVDMRHEKPVGPSGMFSRVLLHGMDEALTAGGQIMLFLNRRGFSTTVLCRQCGWQAACDQCAIQLTHYRRSDRLLCHYCGRERTAPQLCPDCKSPHVRYGGFGTEKVAEAARGLFPGRCVQRMDGETLSKRGAPERIYRDLKEGRIDILVGTQALAKGLDIPNVTLVGVISADTALLIPDFRSSERTFQLMCQVAGRCGRGSQRGQVLIQTFCPEHPSIQAAARHDHATFAAFELAQRDEHRYPPAGHLVRVVAESPKDDAAAKILAVTEADARAWPEIQDGRVQILGPAPCPIPRLKGQHRRHLLFIGTDAETMTELLPRLPRRSGKGLKVLIDRDPVAVM
ncbi:MAG: primosomal protein N' [Planctomycetes bacterium]|nr:primosomal protein N' [Planctomycetota bacterium]